MKYDLFCDAEWTEPKRLETRSQVQIGETLCLMEGESQGNTYRVVAVEHTSMKVATDLYSDVGCPIVTLSRISDPELDQGPQPGYATPTKES